MNVTIRQLQAFIAVSRSTNFSRAAEALHVSQPALSLTIRKLEEQLGARLFERSSRQTIPTAVGRELLPGVQRLVTELGQTIDALTSRNSPIGGEVTLASIPSLSALLLPSVLAAFEGEFPHIRVTLRDAMTESQRMLDLLRAGEFDLALGIPDEKDADLEFVQILQDRLIAIIPPAHRCARRTRVTWAQLAREPLITTSYNSNARLLMDAAFAKIGLSVRPKAEVSLVTTVVGMVEAGLGIGILPDTVLAMTGLGNARGVPIVEPIAFRRIGFVHQPLASMNPAAKLFLKFAQQHIAAGPELRKALRSTDTMWRRHAAPGTDAIQVQPSRRSRPKR